MAERLRSSCVFVCIRLLASRSRCRRLLETSRDDVFAIGDVRSASIKRVAAAVGEGAQVAAALHGFWPRRGRRQHSNARSMPICQSGTSQRWCRETRRRGAGARSSTRSSNTTAAGPTRHSGYSQRCSLPTIRPAEPRNAQPRNRLSRETRPASPMKIRRGAGTNEVSAGNDRPETDVKG